MRWTKQRNSPWVGRMTVFAKETVIEFRKNDQVQMALPATVLHRILVIGKDITHGDVQIRFDKEPWGVRVPSGDVAVKFWTPITSGGHDLMIVSRRSLLRVTRLAAQQ